MEAVRIYKEQEEKRLKEMEERSMGKKGSGQNESNGL